MSAPLLESLARLERHLSLPWVFAALGAITFLIAWNRGIALLYALFAVMAGAVFLSLAGARWMLRAATVRFGLPSQASVGETIAAEVGAITRGWPQQRHLVQLRSPYPFAPGHHLFLPACGGDLVRNDHVVCTRRGVFRMVDVEMACAYPLGLVKVRRRWAVQPLNITIYPHTYPIGKFAVSASASRFSAELERPVPTLGQELFREVREYRRGDNPRHIHWRSSARHGELVVKQFDAIATSETWIVLDLDPSSHAGQGEHHSFERAVEIAASLAAHLIRSGLRCGIAGGLQQDGTPLLLVPPNTGGAHLHVVMEALAKVQPDCTAPYSAVLAAMAAQHRNGQQWILFRHGDGHIALPSALKNQRAPFWFRFDIGSFADPDLSQQSPQPAVRQTDGVLIARDTDLAAMFR